MIRDEKLQYDINREAEKISALSFVVPPDQSEVMEQAKFTYSPLRQALEKQIKTIEDQGENQIKAIKGNRKQLDNTN